jgi:hypothetical protein
MEPLRVLLSSILAPSPQSRRHVEDFITYCHKLAVAYLRVKGSLQRFDARRAGISTEDFALDAIADLFSRNEAGAFSQIEGYVGRLGGMQDLSDDELASALRRLVLSCVNNRIYRVFAETRPSLAKITRNLKLALKKHPTLELTKKGGELFIALRNAHQQRADFPEIAPELIQAHLAAPASRRLPMPKVLTCLGELLEERTGYQHRVRLFQIAYLLDALPASHGETEGTMTGHDAHFTSGELLALIDSAVTQTLEKREGSYLSKKKFTAPEMRAHRSAVREILRVEFSVDGDQPRSYFEILKEQLPHLTRQLYARKHRVVLEYLSKTAQRHVRRDAAKELGVLQPKGSATREKRNSPPHSPSLPVRKRWGRGVSS